MSVHISDDENYDEKLLKLNNSQIDFTDVDTANWIVKKENFPPVKKPKRELKLLKLLVILNSIFPFLIWKKVSKKIPEIEFVDTSDLKIELKLDKESILLFESMWVEVLRDIYKIDQSKYMANK